MRFRFDKLHYFLVERPRHDGLLGFIKRQLLGFMSLMVAVVLSVPGVPGPGFVFFVLAFLWLDFPKKKQLIGWMRHKRWFRVARFIIRKKLNVLLVLPS